jgi:hypothetical protein
MAVFEVTHGGVSRSDLMAMPFDEYHELILEVVEIQRKQSEKIGESELSST